MAYKVVRVPMMTNWMASKFKDAEDDTDFKVLSFPDLDDYLSLMETRGWTMVGPAISDAYALFITLHQPDTAILGSD